MRRNREQITWETLSDLPTIQLDTVHRIYRNELDRSLPRYPLAGYSDYLNANQSTGLELRGNPNRGLVYIVHYGVNGQDIVVPTHNISQFQLVGLNGFSQRYFVSALLWQFHGNPCEVRSSRLGGDRYPRLG